MAGEGHPQSQSEHCEADASERCAGGVDTCGKPTSNRSIETMFGLAFLFVVLDQASAGRKDGWKGEKKPTYSRPITLRNESSRDRTHAAEQKSYDVFVGLSLSQRGKIHSDHLRKTFPTIAIVQSILQTTLTSE